MPRLRMSKFKADQYLVQASMHPTVAAIITSRLDQEVASQGAGDCKHYLVYDFVVGEKSTSVENISVCLPSKDGDIRKTKLLVIMDLDLTRNGRVKTIKGVRKPRIRTQAKRAYEESIHG